MKPRDRRRFLKTLASAAATGVAADVPGAATGGALRPYHAAELRFDDGDTPVHAADLVEGETYLFNYPYATTPCFLIDTGQAVAETAPIDTDVGARYSAPPGVGPRRSVVAFSAICAHRMSHPARQVSFITYRHASARFRDGTQNVRERARLIYCCSERSVYDVTDGARVLGGPAPRPLASIVLEERDGVLHALGTRGVEMFEPYFERFGERLALEYRTDDPRRAADAVVHVRRLSEFSARQVLCGATTPNTTVISKG